MVRNPQPALIESKEITMAAKAKKKSETVEVGSLGEQIKAKFAEVGNLITRYVYSAKQKEEPKPARRERHETRRTAPAKLHYKKTDIEGVVQDLKGKLWYMYHYYNQTDVLEFCEDASKRHRIDGQTDGDADRHIGRVVDPRDRQLYLLLIPAGQDCVVKVPTDKLPQDYPQIWLGTPPKPFETEKPAAE